jgi:hypothetical protein
MISGAVESGLGSTHFSPRNSLPIATRPFCNTVVSIAARYQIFNIRVLSIPAILRDRRSQDLDGASEPDGSDLSFPNLRIKTNPSKSTTVIYSVIRASGVSNLNSCFLHNGYLPK